jgi:hypothetical protein
MVVVTVGMAELLFSCLMSEKVVRGKIYRKHTHPPRIGADCVETWVPASKCAQRHADGGDVAKVVSV